MSHPTADQIPKSDSLRVDSPLERQLRSCVRGLSFPALAHCLRHLLTQMGYSQVRITRQHWKGHNSSGGWDLEAAWEGGLTRQRIIGQIKHSPGKQKPHPVQLRCVDELCGTLARAGAQQGLLLTTGTFSGVAHDAAGNAREITLVDGGQLLGLLRAYRVGLSQDEGNEWRVDSAFFARLHQQFPGQKPSRLAESTHAPAPKATESHTEAGTPSPERSSGEQPVRLPGFGSGMGQTPPARPLPLDGTGRWRRRTTLIVTLLS